MSETPTEDTHCGLCGRQLRDVVSLAAGMGPVCHRRLLTPPGAPTPDGSEQLAFDEESQQ